MIRRAEAHLDKQGRWRIDVQKDGVRKTFRSSTKGRKGKHEAEAAADEWLEGVTGENLRLFNARDLFIKDLAVRTSVDNMNNYESLWRVHISPVIGDQKISNITPQRWRTVINVAFEKGASRRTLENIRGAITAFMTFSRRNRWDIIPIEPSDIQIPKDAPEGERSILQPDALETLFNCDTWTYRGAIVKCPYIYTFRFAVYTGLRRGELCGLKWTDIDGDTLTISRSINKRNAETRGKNKNARRTIVLGRQALEVLNEQRAELMERGEVPEWVFPAGRDEFQNSNSLYKAWKRYCDANNISCSLHELRHTFISVVQNDMPMPMLKSVVGHSTSMDTSRVYGHDVDGQKQEAAKIIDLAFEKVKRNAAKNAAGEKEKVLKTQ